MQTMLSLSTVQIYDHFTYLCSFILHLRDKYELSIDQLPAGWIAQLVRVLHRYRRGHEFDSCSSLNFSGFFFSTALACEQAFSGVGARRREKGERACSDVSGIWIPPPAQLWLWLAQFILRFTVYTANSVH